MSDVPEPKLKPLSDYTFYGVKELIEEMHITFKERNDFIDGRLQLNKMGIEAANLQRYRLNRLPMIADLLKMLLPGPDQDVVVRQKNGSLKITPAIRKLSERPASQVSETDAAAPATFEGTLTWSSAGEGRMMTDYAAIFDGIDSTATTETAPATTETPVVESESPVVESDPWAGDDAW